ncbi:hypothetical protein [Rhodanobacter sp. C05]|uniref:hypothetical protein n=1 Tax=Rhodanobacter sp. C05 TaxID=1945855 RepID=UPI00117A1DCA|nr:hypothetical protein [Rhodanobacter sp. C05]
MPEIIRPWRECPFAVDSFYVVLKSFTALRDKFVEGEILQFEKDAWSRYDGITGYFFRQKSSIFTRVWDIGDGDDIEQWRELFVEREPA